MKRVFIDSSVFIAACASIKGASARVLQLCNERKLHCFISSYVLQETQKNVGVKLSDLGEKRFDFFIQHIPFVIVTEPTETEIAYYCNIINIKDAPILACAHKGNVSHLLTLDKKDLLQQKVRKCINEFQIVTPGEFVTKIY
ncbi:MAG TPA: PIN domain-containing protein [Patescibacteria group bacterium]|nr:PIN domain-containing protein [Patescibacteria group bacterium]